jgi:hypothetical protein
MYLGELSRGPTRDRRTSSDHSGWDKNVALEPQQFAERPCLKRASAGRLRSFGIRDLGNVSDARLIQAVEKRGDESLARLAFRLFASATDSDPGFDEGADRPGPDGSLMIGAVAFQHAAGVTRALSIFTGRERP